MLVEGHRLAEIDAEIEGRPHEPEDPSWAMTTALQTAALRDPELFRVLMRIVGLLATPEHALAEPGFFERVVAGSQGQPRYPLPGADRATLVRTVNA